MDIKAAEQENESSQENATEGDAPIQDASAEDTPQGNQTEMAEEQAPGMIFE